MYHVLLADLERRTAFIAKLTKRRIATVFHYVPIHSAPAGKRLGRAHGKLNVTD